MHEVLGHKVGKLCMLHILAPTCVKGRDGTWLDSEQLSAGSTVNCERCVCCAAASSCDLALDTGSECDSLCSESK